MLKSFSVQQDGETQKWYFTIYKREQPGKIEVKSEPLYPDEQSAERAAMERAVDRMTTRLRILDLPLRIRQRAMEITKKRWDQSSPPGMPRR